MSNLDVLRRWETAAERISWQQRWKAVHEPGPRGGQWFPGATLNAAENCLDRHLPELSRKVALHWEGEPGDRRAITYEELAAEVRAFADALRVLGVGQGDRVALYMGLIPETVVAMLACARLGAVHALIAAALPADALADRLADLRPKALVTQDGAWRHGVILPLKSRADEAIPAATGVEHTIVVRRTGIDVAWYEGDRWYDELVAAPRPGTTAATEPAVPVAADHPLLVVYIANRGGRPTGIVHGTGGFLTYAAAVHADGLTSDADDVLWCAVEIAWVGGQTHAVYGALACGATSVIFEGMLDTPSHRRTWDVVERHGVTTLVTTPSVLRNLRHWPDSRPRPGQLDSLQRVVTAGESSEPELRAWLKADVLGSGAIIADAWGQTELGGIVNLTEASRGDALARPGLDVVDEQGASVGVSVRGELVLREPWPGTFVGIQNGDTAMTTRCWEQYTGAYATGDWARLAPDGTFTFLGRIDLVANVSGQLVSLTEVREALLEHPFVEEAEIIELADAVTGQTLTACVVVADDASAGEALASDLREHVRERLGGLAQPRTVAFVADFPADLPLVLRRRALRLLCATDRTSTYDISVESLTAAAASASASVDSRL
jgi:acetyl-CoA synthetase